METAVRKATRLDYNPPKEKHLSTLTRLTFESPDNATAIIDLIKDRLRENSWIIIFKSLITIHTLMRLGDGEKIISYVETQPSALDTSKLREKSSGVVHIQNIYLYTAYLEQKVIAYRQLRYDYVKNVSGKKESRLRRLSIEDGLLKETIILQKQISTLLKCNFILDDVDNNISLYAFRLLIEDLIVLFQVMNESIVNILEHYFKMDKTSARTSLEIYKRFAKQTQDTISLLERAQRMQRELQISIPTVSHAPLSLAAALQEYLDEDHSVEQTTKSVTLPPTNDVFQPSATQHTQPKELVDFFASLEKETVNVFYNPIIQQQQLQQQQLQQQQLLQLQLQQQQPAQIQQPQQQMMSSPTNNHNPFRTEPLVTYQTNNNNNINPFRASTMPTINPSFPPQTEPAFNNPFLSSQMIVTSPTTMTHHNPFHPPPSSSTWHTMP